MSTNRKTQAPSPAAEPSETPKSKGPVHKIRSGSLSIAIWKNQTKRGEMFSVTATRSYRVGENWKESTSFREADLPVLAKGLEEAHSFLRSQRQ